MSRDPIADHLRFAADLGVLGTSRDPAWRKRADVGVGAASEAAAVDVAAPARSEAPSGSVVDALAAIKADIGPDCALSHNASKLAAIAPSDVSRQKRSARLTQTVRR